MMKRITILGVGNILLTDEGVGVRVIEELNQNFNFPANVELYDGGTGGMSLLAIIEKTEQLMVIDAVLVGEAPGTIVKFNFDALPAGLTRKLSSHEIDVIEVLHIAEVLGKRPPTVFIGIQPQNISSYGTELIIEEYIPKLIEVIIEELKSFGIEVTSKHNNALTRCISI
ncbi:MAG: HyaD/HybD family hydrogenase maturation endopeptidase [bacterium]